MAISKILYMKDCGTGNPGKHLKQGIDYITRKEKTGNGLYVGGLNCQPEFAYEQMRETKKEFGKTDKRQGYHLIISFAEGETTPEQAFEIIGRFVKEYLGNGYEAVYTVHDNTDHIHGHVIFNSVSFMDGRKYRYEKGDWAKYIQPVTNRLCEEYGLSTVEISEDRAQPTETYREWNDYKDGRFVWGDMIRRDLDACVLQAPSFESFLDLLKEKGYEIKQGKHLAVQPAGLSRFRRTKSLGENYTEERLRERILAESLSDYRPARKGCQPGIIRCRVKRLKKSRMSGIQKRYFARMYRLGKLKKRPYSRAWKYRNEIRKFERLQEQYLFLTRHGVGNIQGLEAVNGTLSGMKKEASRDRSRLYRERAKFRLLFEKMEEAESLQKAAASFRAGDDFFKEEYLKFEAIEKEMSGQGYSFEEVTRLKIHYSGEIARMREKEKAIRKELSIAKRLLKELSCVPEKQKIQSKPERKNQGEPEKNMETREKQAEGLGSR
ncbi:relaxase/mobilization nuclease domain-containing protein [Anaerobium acetethylicum]|uniref:Relaxase/Mobilisation nuclease domain-containing protein n=1 Tax=Anaerobium acetethylicum TaxID=1619234 RepID=A0A1D3TUJ2_9FIRM|nr:relaxase/mobilization nuclease domain-containing protein [Anaerobium acetethylicum]SCP97748.1 Relaxase/Mobilisation nuclease domain-containing protein [Anaerobium acetethylicum]